MAFLETDRVFVVQLTGYRNLGFLLLAKRGLPSERHVDELRGLLSTCAAGAKDGRSTPGHVRS